MRTEGHLEAGLGTWVADRHVRPLEGWQGMRHLMTVCQRCWSDQAMVEKVLAAVQAAMPSAAVAVRLAANERDVVAAAVAVDDTREEEVKFEAAEI